MPENRKRVKLVIIVVAIIAVIVGGISPFLPERVSSIFWDLGTLGSMTLVVMGIREVFKAGLFRRRKHAGEMDETPTQQPPE